jgi:hypothetical protein
VGKLDDGAGIAASPRAIEETFVFARAGDKDGLLEQFKNRELALAKTPTLVRVIQVFDSPRLDDLRFARVRVLEAPYEGREAFCFPYDIEPSEAN